MHSPKIRLDFRKSLKSDMTFDQIFSKKSKSDMNLENPTKSDMTFAKLPNVKDADGVPLLKRKTPKSPETNQRRSQIKRYFLFF